MGARPVVFADRGRRVHADTCEQLAAASAAGRVQLHALARGTYPGDRLPETWLPGIRSVGYWNAPAPQSWGLDWHRNEGIELTYLSAGRLAFATASEDRLLAPGDLTITRPWQRHRVGDPHVQSSRLHWLILDVGVRRPNQDWRWPRWVVAERTELERLAMLLRENETAVWRAGTEIARCFERLSRLVAAPATANMGRLAALVNELLLALGDLLTAREPLLDRRLPTSEWTVRLFLEALPEAIEQPWTLDSMAAACGLGRTAFARYCQRQTNLTPRQYLLQCRLQEAARILRSQPSRSITDVALACGFVTSQHFATLFGRWASVSPRTYRRAVRGV
jgi:AraC family L-rhamnose operon regulatory protein RhaS